MITDELSQYWQIDEPLPFVTGTLWIGKMDKINSRIQLGDPETEEG